MKAGNACTSELLFVNLQNPDCTFSAYEEVTDRYTYYIKKYDGVIA